MKTSQAGLKAVALPKKMPIKPVARYHGVTIRTSKPQVFPTYPALAGTFMLNNWGPYALLPGIQKGYSPLGKNLSSMGAFFCDLPGCYNHSHGLCKSYEGI